MWAEKDEIFLDSLKKGRNDRLKFLREIEADPTGYDALGVIRNYRGLIEELEDYIRDLEARRADLT